MARNWKQRRSRKNVVETGLCISVCALMSPIDVTIHATCHPTSLAEQGAAFASLASSPSLQMQPRTQQTPIPSLFLLATLDSNLQRQNTNDESSLLSSSFATGNNKRPNTKRANARVRDIMSLLQSRYPESSPQAWTKTRNYVYHATAHSKTTKKTAQPLTKQQVCQVVHLLDQTFRPSNANDTTVPTKNNLVSKILQSSPRILRKNPTSQLQPTIDFLTALYGSKVFFEAIDRNTDLLLTSGVGYTQMKHISSDAQVLGDDAANCGNDETIWNKSRTKTIPNHFDRIAVKEGNDTVESYFRQELGMTDRNIFRLKQLSPTVFSLSVSDKVVPVTSYLASILSGGTVPCDEKVLSQLRKAIIRAPHLLHLGLESNLKPTVRYLQSRCGVSKYVNGINRSVDFDNNAQHSSVVRQVLKSSPGILGLSVEENLQPTIDLLETIFSAETATETSSAGTIAEGRDKLRKCISRHPQLLGLSIENLRTKVAFFDSIDVPSKRFVSNEHDDKTNTLFSHFDNDDINDDTGHKCMSLAASVALSAPSTYSLSLKDNIIPTVDCLARLWGINTSDMIEPGTKEGANNGFEEKQLTTDCERERGRPADTLSKRLGEYPVILTLSLEENIKPTLDFYNSTGYINLDRQGLCCSSQMDEESNQTTTRRKSSFGIRARYIAASLFDRLLPRWNFYIMERTRNAKNHDTAVATLSDPSDCSAIPLSQDPHEKGGRLKRFPPLHLLAGASDTEFCKHMSFRLARYLKYKEEEAPRLKFRSQFRTWLRTGRPIDDLLQGQSDDTVVS